MVVIYQMFPIQDVIIMELIQIKYVVMFRFKKYVTNLQ